MVKSVQTSFARSSVGNQLESGCGGSGLLLGSLAAPKEAVAPVCLSDSPACPRWLYRPVPKVPARPRACIFPCAFCIHPAVCNKKTVVQLLGEGSSELNQTSVAAKQKAAWALLCLRPENKMGCSQRAPVRASRLLRRGCSSRLLAA